MRSEAITKARESLPCLFLQTAARQIVMGQFASYNKSEQNGKQWNAENGLFGP
jgi:hypothetical protein